MLHNGGYNTPSLPAARPQATSLPGLQRGPAIHVVRFAILTLAHLLQVRGIAYGIPIGFAMGVAAGRASLPYESPLLPHVRPLLSLMTL
jgi:hypothetical protein